jgi:hypothetical protein
MIRWLGTCNATIHLLFLPFIHSSLRLLPATSCLVISGHFLKHFRTHKESPKTPCHFRHPLPVISFLLRLVFRSFSRLATSSYFKPLHCTPSSIYNVTFKFSLLLHFLLMAICSTPKIVPSKSGLDF